MVGALIVVRHFVGIPTWLTITILVVWVLKDIVLFPKVWQGLRPYDDNGPMRQLIRFRGNGRGQARPGRICKSKRRALEGRNNESTGFCKKRRQNESGRYEGDDSDSGVGPALLTP